MPDPEKEAEELKRRIAAEILQAVNMARAPIKGAEGRAVEALMRAIDRVFESWPR